MVIGLDEPVYSKSKVPLVSINHPRGVAGVVNVPDKLQVTVGACDEPLFNVTRLRVVAPDPPKVTLFVPVKVILANDVLLSVMVPLLVMLPGVEMVWVVPPATTAKVPALLIPPFTVKATTPPLERLNVPALIFKEPATEIASAPFVMLVPVKVAGVPEVRLL